MTQKELSYVEDAIGHETNIIKICEESLKSLEDTSLISFIREEITCHESMKEKLMKLLEVHTNA